VSELTNSEKLDENLLSERNRQQRDELLWKKFKVLDDGFICLAGVFGDDYKIASRARTSYGLHDRNERLNQTKAIQGFEYDQAEPLEALDQEYASRLAQANEELDKQDKGLIRRLMRHRHTSPFEFCDVEFLVRAPIYVFRQWHRHRTACLTGDTQIVFERPCDGRSYRLTVEEIFDKFQPTQSVKRPDRQRNAYFKRERVQAMRLRCLNEDTLLPTITNVVDIWESGVKQVFKVRTEAGDTIRCSALHQIHTPDGWKQLKDLKPGSIISCIKPRSGVSVPAKLNEIDPELEEWVPILGWEDYYEISSQGRVRRIIGGRGSRSYGRCKKITITGERPVAVTSLNRPGKQEVVLITRMMLLSFGVEPSSPEHNLVCHNDGNSLNNTIENLRWGTFAENAQDMIDHGRSTVLSHTPSKILDIVADGEEMTYDLEVAGPYHNFVADNIVVHNSINEYSGRYKPMIDSMEATRPDQWRLQSTNNKQGSSGYLEDWPAGWEKVINDDADQSVGHPNSCTVIHRVSPGTSMCYHNVGSEDMTPGQFLSQEEAALQAHADSVYKLRLDMGIAKEQARKDLPVSNYSEMYWKSNLHNLLHFCSLRMASDAQQEIRMYADKIGEIVKELFPITWKAFEDYRLNAVTLSALDIEVLKYENYRQGAEEVFDSKNERDECIAKLIKIGLLRKV
jgi:thymidylate synthase ThyX